MFYRSKFNGNISNWDAGKVTDMTMFYESKFDGDISQWNVSNATSMNYMLNSCPLKKHPPAWYK